MPFSSSTRPATSLRGTPAPSGSRVTGGPRLLANIFPVFTRPKTLRLAKPIGNSPWPSPTVVWRMKDGGCEKTVHGSGPTSS